MSRADYEAALAHPAIAELRSLCRTVDAKGNWIAGAEFADERGWLSAEELAELERARRERPWRVGAWLALEQRVRLDHPKLFSNWIDGEIELARAAKLGEHRWLAIRSRRSRWRIDTIEHPPSGGLFELEERTTWRVSEAETGRVVLERSFERCASFAGGMWVGDEKEAAEVEPAVRIERDVAFVRRPSGSIEKVRLV